MLRKPLDLPQLVYSLLALVALCFLNLVEVKPNRIAAGELYRAQALLGEPMIIFVMGFLLLALLSVGFTKKKALFSGVFAPVLFLFLLYRISEKALVFGSQGSAIRVSFSLGFYGLLLMVYLLLGHALEKITRHQGLLYGVLLLLLLVGLFLLYRGQFEAFSIMKEFQNKREQFFASLQTHLFLALFSVMLGTLLAVPLGYVAHSKKQLEGAVMVPLSILETIPSLSLFGILLVPLSRLGQLPFFRALGVRGIGWAPAVVALTLYSLLPIGRNTLVGFASVDQSVVEAAEGMGMTGGQIFGKIELPLAIPIMLTGVRIALVQTLGGAVLAGLVGGGGLGTFVFLGLAEGSPDLVLLGVMPIVIMTLLLDASLKGLIEKLRRNGR